MDIAITSTPEAFEAAAQLLLHSLTRGDFDADPDFEDAASATATRLQAAGREVGPEAVAVVEGEDLDEILAVIEADTRATSGALARFLGDANRAVAA